MTHNCLECCSFDFQFQYILSGWDGCSSDATIFNDAHQSNLVIPPGKFYLADAGFRMRDALFIPYQKVKYHLAEWGCAALRYVHVLDYRPLNAKELYNPHHSVQISLRYADNIVTLYRLRRPSGRPADYT